MTNEILKAGNDDNKFEAVVEQLKKLGIDIENLDFSLVGLTGEIPRIQLSKNQELTITTGNVPDDMVVNTGVTSTLVSTINAVPSDRTVAELQLLEEIETDVVELFDDFSIRKDSYHANDWNIIRLTWDFGVDFDGSEYVATVPIKQVMNTFNAFPMACNLTAASLIKLESGEIDLYWGKGAEVGKWRFCRQLLTDEKFGSYYNVNPMGLSQTGSMLLALPVVVSGAIDHPKKLFKNIEIS